MLRCLIVIIGFSLPLVLSSQTEVKMTYKYKVKALNSSYIINNDFQPVDTIQSLMLPNRFNFNSLSPFCKIEHYANRQARIPVKFRLGTVDYVDKLESKSNF